MRNHLFSLLERMRESMVYTEDTTPLRAIEKPGICCKPGGINFQLLAQDYVVSKTQLVMQDDTLINTFNHWMSMDSVVSNTFPMSSNIYDQL